MLRYPFIDTISPYADEIEAMTQKWLCSDYAFLPSEVRERYARTRTGMLTARFFPYASRERLIPLAMCSLWGLVFDDFYEHADDATYDLLKWQIGAVIRGQLSADQDSNKFLREMQKISQAFKTFMPYYWLNRFASSMEIYVDGMKEEAYYKRVMKFPTLETYMSIRWRSVDVLQMIDGLEVATEMPLPDYLRHHPAIEELAYYTCRIVASCNDYFSVNKETGRDVMNLVLIMENEKVLSRSNALIEAVKIHDSDLSKYVELEKSVPDFGEYNLAVKTFLDYNNLMIAGHWRWYIVDTLRYRPNGGPDRNAFNGL
ncbi:MAG TPA: terpene synthase family protein [Chitinophaga sp.]|uniref:terpene synthase family protein n=1 Tax=Chitinophaga sp. TaxID=1869181 RepID=UPI002D09F7CC|nr:terpene synthase family protein [Chitinophaga sp.]HVI47127.1 terpene synthase family protein [Chitinophaga sp.]